MGDTGKRVAGRLELDTYFREYLCSKAFLFPKET
jgi:hypothetical protein